MGSVRLGGTQSSTTSGVLCLPGQVWSGRQATAELCQGPVVLVGAAPVAPAVSVRSGLELVGGINRNV